MKANKHFKLSKSSKMMAATILGAERRNYFIRCMVNAEIVSKMAPPRQNKSERKEIQQ
jgi:hypothetical protein